VANRVSPDGTIEKMASSKLRSGDVVSVSAGEFIPGDGEIVEGVASVDESAITGESAPVIREAGGDRSAVTGGTRVLSDNIKVKITSNPGETFLDRMIALVEGAERQKTPNEIALNILLAGLTIIFLLAVVTLQPFAIYSEAANRVRTGGTARLPDSQNHRRFAFRDWYCWHGPLVQPCLRCPTRRRGWVSVNTPLPDKPARSRWESPAAEFVCAAEFPRRSW
jgi:hypothetical protein